MDNRAYSRGLGGLLWAAAASLALVGAAAGCSDNDNPTPTGTFTGGAGGTGANGGAGGQGGEGGGAGGQGGGGGPQCDGPNGCYACTPKTNVQLLNACTDAQCSPFDDVARLPLYNGGNLPPLP